MVQGVHVADPEADAYVPTSHAEQEDKPDEFVYVAAGHVEHERELSGAYWPGRHATQ